MASAWKCSLRFVFMFCVLIINTLTGGFSTPLPLFFLTPVFLTRPLHSSGGKGTTLAGIRLFFREGPCFVREPHRPPLAGRPVGLTLPFPSEFEGLQILARGSLFQKSLIGRAWTLALPDGFSFPLLSPSLKPSHVNLYTHPREEPPPCRCPHGHSTLGLQDPTHLVRLRGGVGAEAGWVFSRPGPSGRCHPLGACARTCCAWNAPERTPAFIGVFFECVGDKTFKCSV